MTGTKGERFASFDGVRIAFDDLGDPGAPVVLLHHGFAADAQVNWHRPGVTDRLVGAGRRIVAVDARGHGRSEKPHEPAAYADGAMVRDVQALLDHLGIEEVDAFGYSMGAIVTAGLLGAEPRVRSAVLGGVGAAILGGRGGRDGSAARFGPIAAALEADDPTTISGAEPRAFRAFADSTGADRLALAAVARARVSGPIDLGAVTVPVLAIAGDADVLAGDPEALAAAIPGATAVRVRGDHLSAVNDPAFAQALVDFPPD